ncbi:MAG: alanine racemase [Paracoccaceae bacterium]|nr:alanine racemase [Paracoccaceae bacterium]MDP7184970.1 alanine racemase [Paracoccaceae bacterium]
MSTASLKIDLGAVQRNWQALDAMSGAGVETSAVVKADGYGLDSGRVSRALYDIGARRFFVAAAEEAAAVRQAVGPDARICVFSGHMAGDTDLIRALQLIPMLNSHDQINRHFNALPDHPFGVQLDTGMNRLGLEPDEWASARAGVVAKGPEMIMSHLACADEPDHAMNPSQLAAFRQMTGGLDVPLSLGATGGILMGPDYHFNITRPGVGLYGGFPFTDAAPVVTLSIPVIQTRDVAIGETVGYSNTWTARRPSRIATIAGGYADGIIRAMGAKTVLHAGDQTCPIVGRISMDMIGVDVTGLSEIPDTLDLLTPVQTVDILAENAGTIGYEILTSLGHRYKREYLST